MRKEKSEYDIQAEEFAEKYNLEMSAVYTGHRARFGNNITAVYSITLTRPGRKPWTFDFSTSINDSWRYETARGMQAGIPTKFNIDSFFNFIAERENKQSYVVNGIDVYKTKTPPSLYDVLACLQKSNPGSFKTFCDEFGYSDDSISDKKTWESVLEEWENVEALFSDCLEELQEIN